MSNPDTIKGPKQWTRERCGSEVRWVQTGDGMGRLQQIWAIDNFVDGEIKSGRTEWRDVPVVPVIGEN